jgi:hypothetical protein
MDWVSFVEKHFVAIVSTHDSVTSYGVPIYYYFVKDDNAFYFITKSETKKYANIYNNKKASLTIFTENPPTVFTANCVAELIDFETYDCVKIKNKLVEIHSTQEFYPSPISTLTEGILSLIKLNVRDCKLKSYKKDIDLLTT